MSMSFIKVDTQLANEAVWILGVKNRTEAVHLVLREIVALKKSKDEDNHSQCSQYQQRKEFSEVFDRLLEP
jgi:Arc/MetJ family transcription regulator